MKLYLSLFFITVVSGLTLILFPEEAMAYDRASASDAVAYERSSPSVLTVDDDILPPEDDILPSGNEPTYKFSIRKVGVDSILYGAVFRLYRTFDEANDDWNPILFTYDEEKLLYTACFNPGSQTSSDITPDITAGVAYIEGLPAGVYYLAEIAAPIGYQKILFPYRIELSTDGKVYYIDLTTGEDMGDAAGGQILIGNYARVLMPGTGGKGANLFYIAGAVCILMALSIALKLKRR